MTIDKLKQKCELTNDDLVQVIREQHPKFNKSTLSMAMHPEDYGVKLTPQCAKALTEHYVPPKPKADDKPAKHRVTVAIDDELYDKLIYARLSRGLTLAQYINLILEEVTKDG